MWCVREIKFLLWNINILLLLENPMHFTWLSLFVISSYMLLMLSVNRYLNSHLSSTLTVRWDDKPGHSLETKLFDYLRPKLHPIFYDSNINSAAIVRLNIYQAFVICAMKFHCYVANISVICSLEPRSSIKTIYSALRYAIGPCHLINVCAVIYYIGQMFMIHRTF